MAYGGTVYSTVSVDIVQTDVDAIIQGLTGYAGETLSDVHDRLAFAADLLSGYSNGPISDTAYATWEMSGYLSGSYGGPITDMAYSMWSMRDYLSGYNYGPLTDTAYATWCVRDAVDNMSWHLSYIDGYLWNGYTGQSAADILGEIRDHIQSIRWQTDQLTFDGNGCLRVATY